MHKTISAGLLSVLLLLAACGGGSSSGGGETSDDAQAASDTGMSGSGGGTSDTDGESVAGTYVGPVTATASAGGFSESVSDTIQIVITGDGTVSIGEPGAPAQASTSLNADGKTFSISVPASLFSEPGFECQGTLTATGMVNGDTITGSISGSNVSCEGIPFMISGSFNLQKN